MGPRPNWCAGNNVWDSAQNLCYNWKGAPVNEPSNADKGTGGTGGSGDCDCSNVYYEKGHKCYKPCGGKEGTGGGGGGGGGGDDHAWYVREIQSRPDVFDTGISEGQWIAWRGFWDDGSKSFRNENVDQGGNAIGGSGFSKPVDCPDGTTKFNVNQCLPLDDWRITSAWGNQPSGGGKSGGGGGGGGTAAASTSLAKTQLPYTGEELHDILANFFNYRAGIFGTNDPYLSGATSRAPQDEKGKDKEIAAYDLPGGGIWWGGKTDLESALAPFGNLFKPSGGAPVTAQATKPKKPTAPAPQTCNPGTTWNASLGACMPEVTGRPAQSPVPFSGPLVTALSQPGFNRLRMQ